MDKNQSKKITKIVKEKIKMWNRLYLAWQMVNRIMIEDNLSDGCPISDLIKAFNRRFEKLKNVY